MGISLEQFVQQLTNSGLMSDTEVTSFQESLPPERKPTDGESLARELAKAAKLTKYQVQAVYQGKIKGLTFGDYRVLDKLGEGGMGVVLKAEHRRMKRVVAVKMISGATLKSPDAVKRFYREVEAAAKLMHTNVVAAFDAAEYGGTHYLMMEYIDGKDLGAIIKEKGPLPVAQAVECIIQAARGLEYAHKQKIVHRDIKPANLLVDKEGTVKILDMGLARVGGLVDEADKDRLTASGQVMGTLDYMAPEQGLDTHHADHRADIYSLGCTLYRLLTSQAPFQGDTVVKILLAHQQAPIPSLRQVRSDVSPELDAVFQKMLAKNPDERQQSMTAVIADLERCMGKRTGAVRSLAEQSGMDGEEMQEALSFLKASPRVATATAAKKKVEVEVQETLNYQTRVETSRQLTLPKKQPAVFRRKSVIAAAIGAGVLAVGLIAFFVIIRIRHPDGKETAVNVPDGSQVTVSEKGDVEVTLKEVVAKQTAKGVPPLAKPLMSASEAVQIQKQWADYLAVPVEMTNSIGMKLVLIPPGEFDMGSTPEEQARKLEEGQKKNPTDKFERVRAEGPCHRVQITKPFQIAAYPVTQAEYEKVMGSNPSAFTEKQMELTRFKPPLSEAEAKVRVMDLAKVLGKDTSRHPVETVSWDEAVEFCRRLSAMTANRTARRVYRLPTEAEWEYSCRSGTTTRWYCGDDEAGVVNAAWFDKNSDGMTHPVGEKKPNAWGLYDMHGNLHQWCSDWFSPDYYMQSPPSDPTGPPNTSDRTVQSDTGSSDRVVRGGNWSKSPFYCCSASRYSYRPAFRTHHYGFRVVCEIVPKEHPAPTATNDAFIKEVAALPPEQQVAGVVAKLKELNPGYDGKESHRIEKGKVTELTIKNTTIRDISPVRALYNLQKLSCGGFGIKARSPLVDLTPLQGLSLVDLTCYSSEVADLSPLQGMPFTHLTFSYTRITDLEPLKGMPLVDCKINDTSVNDLSPLQTMPITCLWCMNTKVKDLSPLKNMPLKELRCYFDPKRDTDIVRSIKTLETINGLPVAEFLKQAEAGKVPSPFTALGGPASEASINTSATTDDAFIKEVAALPPEQQIARVVAKLTELNPDYDGKEEHKIENGQVTRLTILDATVADISPVRALVNLKGLVCTGQFGEKRKSRIADLTPLKGLPLIELSCSYSDVTDLSPLRGLPLKFLDCWGTKVANLSPLQGMQIKQLQVNTTLVTDISPLRGMPLTRLFCHQTKVSDLSPLKDTPLKELRCDFDPKRDTEILRSIKTLETINGLPVAEFWKQVEAGKIPPCVTGQGGPSSDNNFIKEVAALPAEEQVKRVVAKLKELNPGYDGKEEHKIENGQVVELTIRNTTVRDISCVKAMGKLKVLNCGGVEGGGSSPLADLMPLQGLPLAQLTCFKSKAADLSPLRGMRLNFLSCWETQVADLTPLQGMLLRSLHVNKTLVGDLSPLQAMPLTTLYCYETKIVDLSPIKDSPLKEIRCDFDPKRDTEILRSIKTLEKINGLPVAEFWKQVESGTIPRPWANMGTKQEE